MNLIKSAITKNNNKIELFEYKPTDFKSVVLFVGVTHGDEPQGKYLIEKYINTFNSVVNITNRLLFIPCLNPDGMQQNTRVNKNGVDLNRNFPTLNWVHSEKNEFWGGEEPNSEIETQFMVEVIEQYKPNYIISFHAPFKIVNYDGKASELANYISKISGYPVQADIGYPTGGSFGTFCGVERNIPTITLEVDETLSNEEHWKTCSGIFKLMESYE